MLRLPWVDRHPRPPAPWRRGDAFEVPFPEADSAYHALLVGADGRVYAGLSTHRADRAAVVACFDPHDDRFVWTTALDNAALGDPERSLPHGKVHVPIVELDGRVLVATMPGCSRRDRGGCDPYAGFHLLSLDRSTGAVAGLARGPSGEGMVSAVFDRDARVYYGLTYPSGLFCRYRLDSGALQISHDGCTAGDSPVCRSLGVDGDGVVYGSVQDGRIWRAEPGAAPRFIGSVNVLQGAVPPIDRHGRTKGLWRSIQWMPDERRFYGIHAGTQSLFRFDPRTPRLEPLCRLGPAAVHHHGHAPFGAQLGFARRGRVLYHLSHGPAVREAGRAALARSVFLTSYDLDRRRFREHGPVQTAAGERLIFAESLAADAAGRLYTLAWVDVCDEPAAARFRALRAVASNGECRGEVYRLMLVRLAVDDDSGGGAERAR